MNVLRSVIANFESQLNKTKDSELLPLTYLNSSCVLDNFHHVRKNTNCYVFGKDLEEKGVPRKWV
jgi:hypothetical protein